MIPVESARDLDQLRALPCAFVFVYVNWSGQARHSEIAFRDFLAAWAASDAGTPVPIYRVDISAGEGVVWEAVRAWLREGGQDADLLTLGGNGALLWVRAGSVVASVPYVAGVACDALVARTKAYFAPAEPDPAD